MVCISFKIILLWIQSIFQFIVMFNSYFLEIQMFSKLLWKTVFLIVGIFTMLWSGQLLSLTIAKASLEEITQGSAVIVKGTVSSINYQWLNSDHNAIETLVTFDVDHYVKSTGDPQIVVKQMGGFIGDFGHIIDGAPQLAVGEKLVLFLIGFQGKWRIHSIALGCFRIFEKDGSKFVMNDLGNVYLVDPASGREVQPKDEPVKFELNAFLTEVQSYLEK